MVVGGGAPAASIIDVPGGVAVSIVLTAGEDEPIRRSSDSDAAACRRRTCESQFNPTVGVHVSQLGWSGGWAQRRAFWQSPPANGHVAATFRARGRPPQHSDA